MRHVSGLRLVPRAVDRLGRAPTSGRSPTAPGRRRAGAALRRVARAEGLGPTSATRRGICEWVCFGLMAVMAGLSGSAAADGRPVSFALGYPGAEALASDLATCLDRSEWGPVVRASVEMTVPVETDASLELDGHAFPLFSFTPNLVASGPNTCTGEVLYVGSGNLSHVNGQPIRGRLLALELKSGRNWEELAALGASAFIFLQPRPGEAVYEDYRSKVLESPVELPRFLLPFEQREAFLSAVKTPRRGRITRNLRWQTVQAPVLVAVIPGRERVLLPLARGDATPEAVVLLHVKLDGTSLVPGLAPAGDTHLNLLALKTLLESWETTPPPMTILLVAVSGDSCALRGSREFAYRFLTRAGREESNHAERLREDIRHLRGLQALLTDEALADPLTFLRGLAATSDGIRHPLIRKLSGWIQIETTEVSQDIVRRLEIPRPGESDAVRDRIAYRDKLNYLSALKYRRFQDPSSPSRATGRFRKLFRASNADDPDPPEVVAAAPGLLSLFLRQLRDKLSAELEERDRLLARIRSDQSLRALLKDKQIVFTLGFDLTAGAPVMALAGGGDLLDVQAHAALMRQLGDFLQPFTDRFNAWESTDDMREPAVINVLNEAYGEHWRKVVQYPVVTAMETFAPVSYTHLTLPTIYSV